MYFVKNVVRCAIWYHLNHLKNVKNTHGGVLLLVKFQTSATSFTKSNTPPWVFFTFFKLYKWYQIAQRTTNVGIKKTAQGSCYLRQYQVMCTEIDIWLYTKETLHWKGRFCNVKINAFCFYAGTYNFWLYDSCSPYTVFLKNPLYKSQDSKNVEN